MRKYLIALSICAALVAPAAADRQAISAKLAAAKFPVPTFREVHERFNAICANESGFRSLPDQDGILQALLNSGGGGRKAGRNKRGQGYGLDYTRLMRRMARHSMRTFPAGSKFLMLTDAQREWLRGRQTRLNRWTSTLKLDCSQPAGWPRHQLDGKTPMLPWRVYEDRCKALVESTAEVLKGRVRSYCDGRPTTWGNERDVQRKGGPLDQGWAEIHCDRPPDSPEVCGELTRLELWKRSTCARNTFWTWLETDKEATHGQQEVAAAEVRERRDKRTAVP